MINVYFLFVLVVVVDELLFTVSLVFPVVDDGEVVVVVLADETSVLGPLLLLLDFVSSSFLASFTLSLRSAMTSLIFSLDVNSTR